MPDARAIFSTIRPIVLSKFSEEFSFYTNHKKLVGDKNQHLLIIRYFKGRYHFVSENISLLKELKLKYQTVSYFDDGDGADSIHDELLPYLDHYFKSQMYEDKSVYLRSAYGRQQFSEYYHQKYGIIDEIPDIREPLQSNDINKINYLWGLGVSRFPIENKKIRVFSKFLKHFPFETKMLYSDSKWSSKFSPLENRTKKIQARFSSGSTYAKSIGYQRKLILDIASNHQDKYMVGKVSFKDYNNEIKNLVGVISPFGWGEVCFRDYEAVMNHTLLIKPSMAGIMTYPDIYIENETYIPLKWDFDDLNIKADLFFDDILDAQRIVNTAKSVYRDQIAKLDDRVAYLINKLNK